MHIEHHYHYHSDPEIKQLLTRLLSIATQNQTILKELKMTDLEVSDLLDKVNATTNAIAQNQTIDSSTLGAVKTELETLLNAPKSTTGLSDATSAKLQLLATAIGSVQTNATNNSALLTQIAIEGTPVVPPAPPAVTPPPTA